MSAPRWSAALPFLFPLFLLVVWEACHRGKLIPPGFPSPAEVWVGFVDEVKRGRMIDDVIASLYRVSTGYLLSVVLGVPLGIAIGLKLRLRQAFLPTVNFLRAISPLAWIPFAIAWFGIGDVPAIFLIFMSVFFPVALAAAAAVANIPSRYFRVARDYGLHGAQLVTRVTLPAILPQVITSLRVAGGLAWLVVVAAEMIVGRDGLGFLIWDARNQLRPDLLVVGMIVIGLIGVALDRLLVQLTRIPSVRWGYEQ